jgi:hypothetical protein
MRAYISARPTDGQREPAARIEEVDLIMPSKEIGQSVSGTAGLSEPTPVDSLPLVHAEVGYGSLGRDGSLEYEGKPVVVRDRH